MTRPPSPENILDDYIAELLHETDPQPVVTTKPESLDQVRRAQLQHLLDHSSLTQTAKGLAPHNPAAEPPLPSPQETTQQTVDPEAVVTQSLETRDSGRPVWSHSTFDALQFRVTGLNLAVPLVALGQIYPLSGELTPLFGQANWFLGMQPSRQGLLKVVNTARFVMPERYRDELGSHATYVISIDGTDWGLAVDSVGQPMRLHPDEVTWRTRRSQRPWLAGTVKAALCALLDVQRMGELLQGVDVSVQGASKPAGMP